MQKETRAIRKTLERGEGYLQAKNYSMDLGHQCTGRVDFRLPVEILSFLWRSEVRSYEMNNIIFSRQLEARAKTREEEPNSCEY